MNVGNTVILCISLLLSGISSSILNSFFPMESLSKGVTITQCGLIIGIKFIGNVISSFLVGSIMGSFLTARSILMLGLLLVFICNLFFSFIYLLSTPISFLSIAIILRLFLALGETSVIVAGYSLAGNQGGEKHKGDTACKVIIDSKRLSPLEK